MVNPRTGKRASYEEMWREEEAGEADTVLFVKNVEGTTWRACVGRWQLALGRGTDGRFWAWRAEECEEGWKITDSTESDRVKFLPEGPDLAGWIEGATVEWDTEEWVVLERGRSSWAFR
jgi:Protein HRI1